MSNLSTFKKLLKQWPDIRLSLERTHLHIQSSLQIIDECGIDNADDLSDIHVALSKALAELDELIDY